MSCAHESSSATRQPSVRLRPAAQLVAPGTMGLAACVLVCALLWVRSSCAYTESVSYVAAPRVLAAHRTAGTAIGPRAADHTTAAQPLGTTIATTRPTQSTTTKARPDPRVRARTPRGPPAAAALPLLPLPPLPSARGILVRTRTMPIKNSSPTPPPTSTRTMVTGACPTGFGTGTAVARITRATRATGVCRQVSVVRCQASVVGRRLGAPRR